MPSGTPQSGPMAKAEVGGVEIELGKWSFKETGETDRFATSGTDGKKRSIPGNQMADGSLEGKRTLVAGVPQIHSDTALLKNLATGSLKLYYDKDASTGIDIPVAVFKDPEGSVDPAGGTVHEWSCGFEVDGDWSYF